MAQKFKMHLVKVNRISYASRDIEVVADHPISETEAERIALDIAWDFEFSEQSSKYELEFAPRKDQPTRIQVETAIRHIILNLNFGSNHDLRDLLMTCKKQDITDFNKKCRK